jgi:Domain of unknown function (DUF4270)
MLKNNLALLLVVILYLSCNKVDVTFGNETQEGDPNVSYFEDYPIEMSTYKLDSFVTSGHSIFSVGCHLDPLFGNITTGSYAELNLPGNPVKYKTAIFDSLVLLIKSNGAYYGDTLTAFTLNIHRLTTKIDNDDPAVTNYFDPRKFAYDPVPLTQAVFQVRPTKKILTSVKLPDALGKELLLKFRTNSDSIKDQNSFVRYFKGLFLAGDPGNTKAIYYFNSDSASLLLRLYYKNDAPVAEQKYIDFAFNPAKQYNYFSYDYSGTALSIFTPFKKQLKQSTLTGNKSYLHSNMGSYIKIRFPTLLNLKDLHPYIKVIKAQLVITPSPGTFSYPYKLPSSLSLYSTDENNGLSAVVASGGLYTDALYGEKTQYTYDITNFITTTIDAGKFSTAALMLTPSTGGVSDSQLERLVVNDQQLAKGILLKLYVLGL